MLIKIGESRQNKLNNEEFYFWDYNQNNPLIRKSTRDVTSPKQWGLIFQSNKSNRTGKIFYPLYNETDDDIFDDECEDHYANVSIVQCFKIAIEHKLYFFTLTPLKKLSEEEFCNKLLRPVIEEYNGVLPLEIRDGIKRFIEEFDFHDKDKYYNKIN